MPADSAQSSPLTHAIADRDSKTLDLVRDALRRNDAILAYQPVVSAADTSKVAFYEGLIRIRDETGRIIPAKDFIDVTENSEIGRMIDSLTLELGLKALAVAPSLRLSINMSARSIGYSSWNESLSKGLQGDASIAERLILEITESSANLVPDIVAAFMDDMQMKGASFALDDFGAENTSFRHLRDFYFDAAKIDGQYINGISSNVQNQEVVRALVAVCQNMEMFSVASKVSSAEDAAFLADLGVDCLQGYHFGVPTIREPWLGEDTQAARA